MASKELITTVQGYENYIAIHGVDEEVINAYFEAGRTSLFEEKDKEYGLMLSKRTKALINAFIFKQTEGMDIWALERYQQDRETTPYELVNRYYELLKMESEHLFESFMLYMEKNRPYKERFYQPRMNPLSQVAQLIQDLYDDKLDEGMVFCPGRIGKANPLYSKILTPDGFIEMRNIKIGSKVISGDGTICNVTGVFPQGIKDVYRVVFNDGTSAECCKEHLWRVQTAEDRRKDRNGTSDRKYRVIELKEICKNLKIGKKEENNYSVDYVRPIQFEKKELPIPPYVLGVILGDGYIGNGYLRISNPEEDIFEKVKKLLIGYAKVTYQERKERCKEISITKSNINNDLNLLGLSGKRSQDKFIPWIYLMSDVEDRVELLRGLCDTDGSVVKNFVDYSTASKELAENIVFLVRSLGGRATLKESDSHYTKDGKKVECRKRYRVTLTLNGELVPVSSNKNLKKYSDNKKVKKKFIERVEYVGKEECQCIMVDNPQHLYVMDDFIVTHNTQIVKMGNLWFGSNRPERSNLYSAYSDKITGGFYDGTYELMTDPTYTYSELYPKNVEKKPITDGKDLTIDLVRKKTYPTFTMRSIYGTLNGACDCDGLGIYDDLFSGIDEALSEDRQNTVWGKFDNNYMPRIKPGKAKLLGIGTRWAPRDVQGRRLELLLNDPEYASIRHREIIIPALNENGESNFDYPYKLGYTTLDYKRRMSSFENNDDLASWLAQYQQEPIERRGQMFNVDTMNFFNPAEIEGIRPDRIFAANDPAYGGGDFVSMPICYEIDGEHYVVDAVYNDGEKDVTIPEVASRIESHLDKFKNKTAEVHFEETKTTSGYRTECEKIWKEDGYPVNTTHDPADNKTAKMDRIKNHAPDIRKLHFVDMKYQSKEYRKYFQNILSCTYDGKMKHDDGVDSTAQLCDMIYGSKRKVAKVEAVSNPFRTGGYGYGV